MLELKLHFPGPQPRAPLPMSFNLIMDSPIRIQKQLVQIH